MNNTVIRSISGIIFLAIMIGGLLWHPVIFALIMGFAIAVMQYEYLQIATTPKFSFSRFLSIFSGVSLFTTLWLHKGCGIGSEILFFNTIPLAAILIAQLYYNQKDVNDYPTGHMLGSVLYIALPFSLTNFIVFGDGIYYNPAILLGFFVILWSSDVGAYIFGMTFGQKNGHKLFPSVSPKKSWEGFFGGLFSAILAGYFLNYYNVLPFGTLHSIIIALIINIGGVYGDLVESHFKRNFGVKDSGGIMPGHGGLLDRFDGALIAFPLAITYLIIFELI